MAFFLLNCSVDTTGLFTEPLLNNQVVNNDQESIIEVVVEQLLGFDNLIPETADDDASQTPNLKKAKVTDIFVLPNFALAAPIITSNHKKAEFFTAAGIWDRFHFKIPSPPPEI